MSVADWLGLAGVLLVVAALALVHPALALGAGGLLCVALSVALHREGHSP